MFAFGKDLHQAKNNPNDIFLQSWWSSTNLRMMFIFLGVMGILTLLCIQRIQSKDIMWSLNLIIEAQIGLYPLQQN